MLNTLVVGLGARGRNILLENVLCAPDWNIVAASEPSAVCRKATTELMPELPLFDDYGEALRETECDVVAVYTPGPMHGEHIAVALEAGRHVLVEKPFTLSHREAVDLTRLAEANKLKIAVGQNLRYLPLFRELRRKVAAGDWGKIGYLATTQNRYRPAARNLKGMAHAWLLENAIHEWDRLLAVVQQRPTRIYAREFDTPWSDYLQGATDAVIEFEGGVNAITQGSFISQSNDFRWRMDTEAGTVLSESEQAYRLITPDSDTEVEVGGSHMDGTRSVVAEIFAYFSGGEEPECSARNNLRTVQLVCAGVRSAVEGCPIDIPEAADQPVD